MDRIGPYRILRTLETAASSQVLLAMSEAFGVERQVVLKRMLPSARNDEAANRRFAREALAYARLTHPAIVRMYDFFAFEEQPVLVLEYVDGLSLEQLLISLAARKQTLSRDACFHVSAGVFDGLAAAHAARDPQTNEFAPIIHRDVSPGNVLMTRDGAIKLADFGFAKVVGKSPRDTFKTRKGSVGYMAPEQVLHQSVTVRTDIYGGALLLREMLTGEPAFPVAGTMPQIERIANMAHPSLAPIGQACADLPAALEVALDLALRPNQEERTVTAAELHQVLIALTPPDVGARALKEHLDHFHRARQALDAPTLPPPPALVEESEVDIDWDPEPRT